MTFIKAPKIRRQVGKDIFYIIGLISSNEAIEVYDTIMVVVVIENKQNG